MHNPAPESKIPGYRADRLLDSILRYRKAWQRYHRPDDVNRLLRMFPRVSIQRGYQLDYLRLGGSHAGWIWPYARQVEAGTGPPPELAAVARDHLAGQRGTGRLRQVEIATLYRRLEYEPTPEGLFQYALFISELWSLKSEAKAGEWLETELIFTRRKFEAVLRKVGGVVRVARPRDYDPISQPSRDGGGEVRVLAFHPRGWKRIYLLRIKVDPEGMVQRQVGDLIATLR